MKLNTWSVALGVLLMTSPALADSGATVGLSRGVLMAYYESPDLFRRVEGGAGTVSICTDYCEEFSIGVTDSSDLLWDAALLYKAFMSHATIDIEFRDAYNDVTAAVLRRHRSVACRNASTDKAAASCALKKMSKQYHLTMKRIVFDEGNRCESGWTFDLPQKILSQKCRRAIDSRR
jgi:hypothetical protein